MRNTKKFIISVKIAAAAMAALTLCACAPQSAVEPVEITESSVQVNEEVVTEYVPQTGGELYLAIPDDVTDMNPLTVTEKDMADFLTLIYEKPLNLTSDGRFEPGLCETWSVDETGTVYTFNMRQGVVFHDGSAFSADDVIYTLREIMAMSGNTLVYSDVSGTEAAQTGTGQGSTINAGDGLSEAERKSLEEEAAQAAAQEAEAQASAAADGAAAQTAQITAEYVNKYAVYNGEIASVKKTGDYSIEITMNSPGRDALYLMTFPVIKEGTVFTNGENGTGAYRITSATASEIVLGINADWWRVTPYIETIIGKKTQNSNNKLEDYESGTVDLITTDSVSVGKQKSEGQTQTADYQTKYYDCIVPNLFTPALKSANVRKAISYAINRREIIASVLLNHAVPAEMPIEPSFYAYDVKYKLYEYDTDAAMELLNAEGYYTAKTPAGNKIELTMIVASEVGSEYRLEVSRRIKKQLEEIGIACELLELSAADYMERLTSGNFDIAYCSFFSDQNPDVSYLLESGAACNYGYVASTELDGILKVCREAVTEDDVTAAYAQLQQYFLDKVPQIGLFYRMNSIVAKADVVGIEDVFEGHLYDDIATWSIKPDN